MPRRRGTGRKGKEEEEASVAAAAAVAGKQQQKNRLSKGEIRWILAQKPTVPPERISDLKRSNPELSPRPGEEADEDKRQLYRIAKAFYEWEERLPKVQEWVRGELEKKGYVELDDAVVRRRAEVQAVIDREWAKIEAKMQALILEEEQDGYHIVGVNSEEGGEDEEEDQDI